MTTLQIQELADVGRIAAPDINLGSELRYNVIPAFYSDIGAVSWRRGIHSATMTIGEKNYDLPAPFHEMTTVILDGDTDHPLPYIGEDPLKVLAASGSTEPGKPGGYHLLASASDAAKRIAFDCPPDRAYVFTCLYQSGPTFADSHSSVDLNPYIPERFQWALVEGLKKSIMKYRFGIADDRYARVAEDYAEWIGKITENKELAKRNYPVFAS